MSNCAEYLQVLFAAWFAGLAAVPINARLHPREIGWIVGHSGARLVFTTPDLAASLGALTDDIQALDAVIATDSDAYTALATGAPARPCERTSPNDLAWLFYTSGTTGRPKGAMLSHRNLLAMTMNYLADVDGHFGARLHRACRAAIARLRALRAAPYRQGSKQRDTGERGVQSREAVTLIARWPRTTFFFAPTMVNRLVQCSAVKNAELKNLKTIVYGGGPMYLADVRHALEVLGPKLVQIYGQGEAPMTITALPKSTHVPSENPNYLTRLTSVGVARTDVEVRVVNDFDEPLRAGEIGEVVCRGDVVMTGYWRDLQATADTLRGGWLHTGDIGSFDEDGYLTLKDRAHDVIISGGSNIYPREVEEALLAHPGVAEVSVVGRRDPKWGEAVVAFVVAKPDAALTAETLNAACSDRIARFKRPQEYRFVESLPKNNYGKVLKTELRAQLAPAVSEAK
jgi:acyl-CoA synthetase (AMP-forming)/AMP-acid ligase II